MKARIKKLHNGRILRFEASGEVKEVIVKEELLNPSDEAISICFRGRESSGIIELSTKELDDIYSNIKSRTHLIKGMKIFRDER